MILVDLMRYHIIDIWHTDRANLVMVHQNFRKYMHLFVDRITDIVCFVT